MPNTVTIQLLPPSIPAGLCFATEQDRANFLFLNGQANLVSNAPTAFYNLGSTTPLPEQRQFPWFKLNNDGSPVGWFTFYQGAWVRPHPVPAGSNLVQWWDDSLGNLALFEGGDAGPITATTGAFWQEATSMQGRFPIHPGTMPSTLVISQGSTGGLEAVTLTGTDTGLAGHQHVAGVHFPAIGTIMFAKYTMQTMTPVPPFGVLLPVPIGFVPASSGYVSPPAGDILTGGPVNPNNNQITAHPNLPPYRGLYAIKRTARVYFVG